MTKLTTRLRAGGVGPYSLQKATKTSVGFPLLRRRASEKKSPKIVLVFAFLLLVSRTGTGDGCLFLLEPRLRLKAKKNEGSYYRTSLARE